MALIPMNRPDIDRIIELDYEAYTSRLFDEAYGDHGERCKNCKWFVAAYHDVPSYCSKQEFDEIEDDEDFINAVDERLTDPDDCCEDWEWDMIEDEPEDDY